MRRALLIAGPTASGKSALGAGAGGTVRRDHFQRGFDAGLRRPENPDRATDSPGGAARSASPVRRHRRRGQFLGRTMGGARPGGARRHRRPGGHRCRRDGALLSRADRGPVRHAGGARSLARPGARAGRRPGDCRASRRPRRARSARPPPASGPRTARGSCARSKSWPRPGVRSSRFRARGRRRRFMPANGRGSFSVPIAPSFIGVSTLASRR